MHRTISNVHDTQFQFHKKKRVRKDVIGQSIVSGLRVREFLVGKDANVEQGNIQDVCFISVHFLII